MTHIIIQKSDKGNSVVILDRPAYIERMTEILSDTSKFQKLSIDGTKDYNFIINQEDRIKKVLLKLKKEGIFDDKEYARLSPCGSKPSVLYGLSKVHKTVVDNKPKQRPILSAINTPTYNLSKFLVKVLEPYTKNSLTARDSFSFASEVRGCDTNKVMASLDVEALFTNIPLEETIDICVQLAFKDREKVDGMNRDQLRSLLSLATKESLILFDGSYYQQVDGVAMGSPLGPTFANIFLAFHEEKWLSSCPENVKPTFFRRYVDDIFLLFDHRDHVESFKAYMNSCHPNMKFTSELEEDNVLPFLDVKVIRSGDSFVTSVYRKPTFSGVYTNYNSFLPDIYKTGLVRTLLFRLFTICSDWNLIHREIEHLRSVMRKNAYPDRLIDGVVKRFLQRVIVGKEVDTTVEAKENFNLFLPYLGTLTKQTEHSIRKIFKQHLPTAKVRLITKATVRLSSLFCFKDKVPQYLKSGLIYKFTCGTCNGTYIGKSKRHQKTRFCEHLGISALTGKPVKTVKPSAVSDHRMVCHSEASMESFSILGGDSNNWHLLIKESLFIHKFKPVLNANIQSVPLKLF